MDMYGHDETLNLYVLKNGKQAKNVPSYAHGKWQ
jgi:hypothetical protein